MNEMEKQQKLGDARVAMVKRLEKLMDSLEDELEEMAEEAMLTIDPPSEVENPTDEQILAYAGKIENLKDEAIRQFHTEALGRVWAMVSFSPDEGMEVELFGNRPKTADGDPSNWPVWFRVYEGELNGGDTFLVDKVGERLF